MEAIVLGILKEYIEEALANYLITQIRSALTFDRVVTTWFVPQYPHAGLYKTSQKNIQAGNLNGEWTINKVLEHEKKLDVGSIIGPQGTPVENSVHFLFPLITSYVDWQTDVNLDSLNIKKFRAYPNLYKLGSVHLESKMPDLNSRSSILSEVFLNRNRQLEKTKNKWVEDFDASFLNERVLRGDSRQTLTGHFFLAASNGLINAMWNSIETVHYSLQVPGTITTYGWPSLLVLWGQDDPPAPPPSLPDGSLG